mmetsp:Transcript_25954/g.65453  ORF Transcript_25954/g.65453 Transcript_25954/m.65453 type:complete len:259 (+) Transcript_25954:62-838(+)
MSSQMGKWLPYLGSALLCWFLAEGASRIIWRQALGTSRSALIAQRCAVFTVRLCHAVGAVLLVLRVFSETGWGMSGAYDETACAHLPAADIAIIFSLSWSLWELVSVLRDVDNDTPITVLHTCIMMSAQACVLFWGPFKQMMCVCLAMEASTVFLNPRLILLELWGKSVRPTCLFKLINICFGSTFIIVRLVMVIPRYYVHISVIYQHGRAGDISEWAPCLSNSLATIDVVLFFLQTLLNCLWGRMILSAAMRGEKQH